MKLTSQSFQNGDAIPERFAFAKPDPKSHVVLAENENPELSWTDVPPSARSLVLICHDSDAPTQRDNVNKEGLSVPLSLPRADFTHWVLIDIPPQLKGVAQGEFSKGVTARGKPGPAGPGAMRQGLNSYTQWFQGDKDMEGPYYGYDGPCPPWNDERVHHYHFTLYALDLERVTPAGDAARFGRDEVLAAIRGHVLAMTAISCSYTLNPKLR